MSLRVIAGSLRHRTLSTPKGQRTRPTAARVREALFSILGPLDGARVLDLYAGSGALGIEALSRGAERAWFVESERAALTCLRANITELELGARAVLVARRVELAFATLASAAPFDLVLCDPPWAEAARASVSAEKLASLLAPGARFAFEHRSSESVGIHGLRHSDTRRWGDTAVSFFEPALDPLAEALPEPERP